jgi:hypothetical protein
MAFGHSHHQNFPLQTVKQQSEQMSFQPLAQTMISHLDSHN